MGRLGLRRLQGRIPQLRRQDGHRLRHAWERDPRLLSREADPERLPPRLQHARDGVWRAGPEERTDPLDSRPFSGDDERVCGGVDLRLGDASGHGCRPPTRLPCSADCVRPIKYNYRKYKFYFVVFIT